MAEDAKSDERAGDAQADTSSRLALFLRSRHRFWFVREIAVVLVGVLLALLLQETVNSWRWQQKTEIAERNMREDIALIRLYARERIEKAACSDIFLAGMEQAILTGDAALSRRLMEWQIPDGDSLGIPIPSRPWPQESWDAAQVGQIIDQLGSETYGDYGWLATAAETLQDLNDSQNSEVATISVASYGLPPSTESKAMQLAALGRLRASEILMRRVAARYIERSDAAGLDGPGHDVSFFANFPDALLTGIARCNAAAAQFRWPAPQAVSTPE